MTQTPRAWDPKVVLEGDSIKIDDLKVSFHRTVRDHKDYHDNAIPKSMPGAKQETEISESSDCSLPASMGRFPLARCDDYRQGLPDGMENEGGVFFPMYRKSVPMLFFESPTLINLLDSEREAMWISFVSDNTYAIKIFAGNVNAISGKPDTASHKENQATRKDLTLQDFVVTPHQHWLDGVATEAGRVQFVAMPMGSGHSTEAPVTGQDSVGRLNFEVTRLDRMPWEACRMDNIDIVVRQNTRVNIPCCLPRDSFVMQLKEMIEAKGGEVYHITFRGKFLDGK